MLPLRCRVQTYAWGKKGRDSMVAQFMESSGTGDVDPEQTYAELWMGTHSSAPSAVVCDGEEIPLQEFFRVRQVAWREASPVARLAYFLLLSVSKALSIQAHPDKELAERLHAEAPTVYKDPNHKPEMAVAITPFEGMCGFRPLAEIVSHLESVPELRRLVGEDCARELRDAAEADTGTGKATLRRAFSQFMQQSASVVERETGCLVDRLRGDSGGGVRELVLRLSEQFPGDIGLFAPYWLNVVTLSPGEALFLAANEPHAYLSGDCVECMACSDNVVRAGLTPKFKDVRTLCDMLTYTVGAPNVLRGQTVDDFRTEYRAPVPEFRLSKIVLPGTLEAPYSLPPLPSAAILLVTDGSGTAHAGGGGDDDDGPSSGEVALRRGRAFLLAAGSVATLNPREPLTVHCVYVNEHGGR